MLAANNNGDKPSNAIPIPTSLLIQHPESSHTDNTLPTTPIQGIMCNDFSFPLLYHADILSPFTCKLFHDNTLVNDLPVPKDNSSFPISLTYLRYYLQYDSTLDILKDKIRYPTLHDFYLSNANSSWTFHDNNPKTASPFFNGDVTKFLTICTHQSCKIALLSNDESIGFLIQSLPSDRPSQCPMGSTQIWIDSTEKCITPQRSLPSPSLAPFFVHFPPSTTKNHIYFLESSLNPLSAFQLQLAANIPVEGDSGMKMITTHFLIKGLSPFSAIVDDCHVHDLHKVFPIAFTLPDIISIESIRVLLERYVRLTFHTPVHSYGVVEKSEPKGRRFISLVPLQYLKREEVKFKGGYDGKDWLDVMKELRKLGMEVTQLSSFFEPQEDVSTTYKAINRSNAAMDTSDNIEQMNSREVQSEEELLDNGKDLGNEEDQTKEEAQKSEGIEINEGGESGGKAHSNVGLQESGRAQGDEGTQSSEGVEKGSETHSNEGSQKSDGAQGHEGIDMSGEEQKSVGLQSNGVAKKKEGRESNSVSGSNLEDQNMGDDSKRGDTQKSEAGEAPSGAESTEGAQKGHEAQESETLQRDVGPHNLEGPQSNERPQSTLEGQKSEESLSNESPQNSKGPRSTAAPGNRKGSEGTPNEGNHKGSQSNERTQIDEGPKSNQDDHNREGPQRNERPKRTQEVQASNKPERIQEDQKSKGSQSNVRPQKSGEPQKAHKDQVNKETSKSQEAQRSQGSQADKTRDPVPLTKRREDTEVLALTRTKENRGASEGSRQDDNSPRRNDTAELNASLNLSSELPFDKDKPDTHQNQLMGEKKPGQGGAPFFQGTTDQKGSAGDSGALQATDTTEPFQKERDSSIKWFKWRNDRVGENGEMKENPYNGAGYYILGALLVLAMILFFVFRRRGRRGGKGKEEKASTEELLHNNSV